MTEMSDGLMLVFASFCSGVLLLAIVLFVLRLSKRKGPKVLTSEQRASQRAASPSNSNYPKINVDQLLAGSNAVRKSLLKALCETGFAILEPSTSMKHAHRRLVKRSEEYFALPSRAKEKNRHKDVDNMVTFSFNV